MNTGVRGAGIIVALFTVLSAQEPPKEAEAEITFKSDVSLVRVDAQVVTSSGQVITGLSLSDFTLREEGLERAIRNFAREEVPVDIVLLLDVSGSMRPQVELVASAANRALRVLGEDDRVAIMVFDRRTRVHLPLINSREDVERGLQRMLEREDFGGGTDVPRGIIDAANYLRKNARPESRRAVVILTDDMTGNGRDDAGIMRALTEADAVLSLLLAPDAMGQFGPLPTNWPNGQRMPRSGGNYPPGGTSPSGRRATLGDILGGVILGGGGGMGIPGGGSGGQWPGGGGRRMPPGVGGGYGTEPNGTPELARQSGGDSIAAVDASALEQTLARIRQRYALHFLLPGDARRGQERRVEVGLTAAARRQYPNAEILYRGRYIARADGGGPDVPVDAPAGVTVSEERSSGQGTGGQGTGQGTWRQSDGETSSGASSRTGRRPASSGVGTGSDRSGPLPSVTEKPKSVENTGAPVPAGSNTTPAATKNADKKGGWRTVDDPEPPTPPTPTPAKKNFSL